MKSRALLLCAGLAMLGSQVAAQDRVQHVVGTPDNEVRLVNGYPEYWVDGKPFIMHAAAFFYTRIPRDRWAEELQRLKSMGVNTIDVYPFWNWHEPEEGVFDFDGHTNSRRDLKGLLDLVQQTGFKVTLRPGPYFTAEWRNGGYPDWLLRRPEYGMSEQAILESRYPRLSALQYDKSDEAAAGYLANQTHLRYSREWYKQVLAVATPYLAGNGGNVLNIQIDDDQAIGPENFNGPNFWKYMDTLRGYAKEATQNSDLPYYVNGADMRLNAESNDLGVAPFWNMGQDYQMSGPGGFSTPEEAAKNKFTTDNVKMQPLFPASIIEFGSGWRLNERDSYETPAHDASNLLMASRVFFQNGLKGLNYYSLNDTLYPAGYEAPWANYFYAREGVVAYTGEERGAARYARRNGRLIEGMGPLLGATHPLVDAALIYSMSAFPQRELTSEEANYVADSAKRIAWAGAAKGYNFELVDSDHTPAENFQRYKLLLLFDPAAGGPHLRRWSVKAQEMVRQYLEAGGTVLLFPTVPQGEVFDQIFRGLGTRDARGEIVPGSSNVGKGRVIFFAGDFSLPSTRGRAQPKNALSRLMQRAGVSHKVYVQYATKQTGTFGVYATELISDSGSLPFERRSPESLGYGFVGVTNFSTKRSYSATLTVTDPRATDLAAPKSSLRLPQIVLPPRESLLLPIRVPLDRVMGGGELDKSDEIFYATVELSRGAYDGRKLSLDFTAPMGGEVALRLTQRPESASVNGRSVPIRTEHGLYVVGIAKGTAPHFVRHVEVDYPRPVPSVRFVNRATWIAGANNLAIVRVENPGTAPLKGDLEVSVGPSPAQHAPIELKANASTQIAFRAQFPAESPSGLVLALTATLRDGVKEVAAAQSGVTVHPALDATVEALPGVTFPLREDQTVPIIRPLLASVDLPGAAKFQVRIHNWSDQPRQVTVSGQGQDLALTLKPATLQVPAGGETAVEFSATPQRGTGVYRFAVGVVGDKFQSITDVVLAAVGKDEALAYSFDYDRDGFDDLILENERLRCFVSPHAGGRSFAFVRKETNHNAFTSVGGMRDNFTTRVEPPDMHGLPDWTTEKRLGLYNRPYSAQIVSAAGPKAEVEMEYDAPDIYPGGIHLKRTMGLAGDRDMLVETTSLTPLGTGKPQALVIENSVPFPRVSQDNPYSWFVDGHPLATTVSKKTGLPPQSRLIGTLNQHTREVFAAVLLTQPQGSEIVPEAHSALLRLIYPDFAEAGHVYTYSVGYYLGRKTPSELWTQFRGSHPSD